MYRFLESIRIENGLPAHLEHHIQRMMKAAHGNSQILKLVHELPHLLEVKDAFIDEVVKARLLYDETGHSVEFLPYQKQPINELFIKSGDHISYVHKFADRHQIEQLKEDLPEKSDVLILKNGFVTDCSYCNVAFLDGTTWFTPVYPLLKGTQRQFLLDSRVIKRKKITISDFKKYQKIRLFNAMIPWDEAIEIPVEKIVF